MEEFNRTVIREYQSIDNNKLKEIARACFEDDILHVIDQPNTLFAYTALLEDEIIGTVFAWKSDVHSNCTYFRIFVTPSIEHKSIEKELFEVLLEQAKEQKIDNLPLQTSIWETSVDVRNLYRKTGFRETRKTYEPTLKVDDALAHEPIEIDSNVQTVEEITVDKEIKNNFIQLIVKNYMLTHEDNPVSASMGQDVWERLIFADDLIENGSYVYVDEHTKEVLAYSLLHESDQMNTFELGWCGAMNSEHEGLIPRLVQHQALYAQKCNVQHLLGEFDTTDEAAMGVLASFPFKPCPTWVTYSLKQ